MHVVQRQQRMTGSVGVGEGSVFVDSNAVHAASTVDFPAGFDGAVPRVTSGQLRTQQPIILGTQKSFTNQRIGKTLCGDLLYAREQRDGICGHALTPVCFA
jgi:hypothetical protein